MVTFPFRDLAQTLTQVFDSSTDSSPGRSTRHYRQKDQDRRALCRIFFPHSEKVDKQASKQTSKTVTGCGEYERNPKDSGWRSPGSPGRTALLSGNELPLEMQGRVLSANPGTTDTLDRRILLWGLSVHCNRGLSHWILPSLPQNVFLVIAKCPLGAPPPPPPGLRATAVDTGN